MAIQGIDAAVQQLNRAAQAASGMGTSDTPVTNGGFAAKLTEALDNISGTQNQADTASQAYSTGATNSASPLGLNDVMVDMQKSSIALQTGVQVRNKLVTAYNDIMNMSV